MSTQNSEPQLAEEARTALLEAVTKAAKAGRGDEAKGLAEAYAIISTSAPRETQGTEECSPWFNTPTLEDALRSRR